MESIADSTDPGTRRPTEPSFDQSGAYFQPFLIPQRNKQLNSTVIGLSNDPFALWQLFFTPNHMQLLTIYTNMNARIFYQKNAVKFAQLQYKRPWHDVTIHDLYAIFAIYIYMGIHKEPRVRDYWNQHIDKPLHPLVYRIMSANRFEAIDRFFHVSNPEESSPEDPFSKLEPLNSHVMKICKQNWQAGRDLAVDECMQRFQGKWFLIFLIHKLILLGRSKDTLNIPKKPTPIGYKIWALAEDGYILHWIWHRKRKGPVGLLNKPPEGLNQTQAVVPYLLGQLSRDFKYHVWLDNLFTSYNLLLHLRKQGWGAAGIYFHRFFLQLAN